MVTSDWTYGGAVVTSEMLADYIGFVYCITNKANGKKYIGKKMTKSFITVKGKKKTVESNWRAYYGSSQMLLGDLAEVGPDGFYREILHLCKTKGACSYLEMKEQILRDVLLKDDYYNQFVGGKIHSRHLKELK